MAVSNRINQLRAFHNNENGESAALGNILLLAVAALVVVGLIAFGKTGMQWLRDMWDQIAGESLEG